MTTLATSTRPGDLEGSGAFTILDPRDGSLVGVVDESAALDQRETGKTRADSEGRVRAGIATLRQCAQAGPLHRGHSLLGSATASYWSVPEPHGVVAAVTPWNDPVAAALGAFGTAGEICTSVERILVQAVPVLRESK